jgi:hypothetical protein
VVNDKDKENQQENTSHNSFLSLDEQEAIEKEEEVESFGNRFSL